MTDKEVGELWTDACCFAGQSSGERYWQTKIEKLIRKLVEERALYKYADHGPKDLDWEMVAASYRWNALNDFGIDPKDLAKT